jgi:hypothetical protein
MKINFCNFQGQGIQVDMLTDTIIQHRLFVQKWKFTSKETVCLFSPLQHKPSTSFNHFTLRFRYKSLQVFHRENAETLSLTTQEFCTGRKNCIIQFEFNVDHQARRCKYYQIIDH